MRVVEVVKKRLLSGEWGEGTDSDSRQKGELGVGGQWKSLKKLHPGECRDTGSESARVCVLQVEATKKLSERVRCG